MNNKVLGIIFIALAGIFLLTRFLGKKQTRSFKEDIVQVDTSKVDRITIHSRGGHDGSFNLEKSVQGWEIKSENLSVPADDNPVRSLLNQVALIKAKQIIARTQEKWPDYEVGLDQGARVEVYGGNKKLADFVIGRLNFNQQTRTALTYLRVSEEEDTYAVDGFLNMNFSQDPNYYRNRSLVNIIKDDIQSIGFSEGDSSTQISGQDNQWVSNTGIPIDSAKMAQYLNRISRLNGSEFYDESLGLPQNPTHSMRITANNVIQPVILECFINPEDSIGFIVHSSQNPHGYFLSDSTGIFKTLVSDFKSLTAESSD